MVYDSIHIMKENLMFMKSDFFSCRYSILENAKTTKLFYKLAYMVRNYWESKKVIFCFGFVKIL